jgi:hypothetical protein
VASLRIPHDAQDARRIRLQHINNNHPHATAKGSQVLCLRPGRGGGERTLILRCRECC